ncbi:DUF397 domain-containing protein [Streptosporangium sp. NBC_01755]|nr:DUF397 domain-containing protein [Streptosporangium sp. NBC_01755]WSA24841.1 DUF397 domain-containing protein [Streptosporangium sp. NBC_01810]WSD03976.1 DUF397 domain-containing protein [Streptosporangium sp. NBC_01755]
MAPNGDPPHIAWRKSSYSTDGGNCVEVARAGNRYLVRDSKNPHGATLSFSPGDWTAFLGRVKTGDFDTHP